MAETIYKYARTPISTRRTRHLRQHQDPVMHDKYYAYLKHRCQAKYRGERYQLTWQDWCKIWTPALWAKRGRKPRSVRLTQIDQTLGWSIKNCKIRQCSTHMREQTRQHNAFRKKNDRSL
jgi:hypothetical protein